MKRITVSLAMCCVAQALNIQQYVEQHVEESIEDTSTACSHEQNADSAVTGWPSSSWYVLHLISSSLPSFLRSAPN